MAEGDSDVQVRGVYFRCSYCNAPLTTINGRLPDGWVLTMWRPTPQSGAFLTPHIPACKRPDNR